MILLVITSKDILLNLSIVLIYHLISNGSSFKYIKPHLFIIGNRFSYIALLKNVSARYLCYSIIFPFVEIQFFLVKYYWDLDLLLWLYNCKLMTQSFYRLTLAYISSLYCNEEISLIHIKF